jgi:hypothetical protein
MPSAPMSMAVCTERFMARRKEIRRSSWTATAFSDELGVEFRLLDFEDVDLHLLATAHFGNLLAHHFDFLALTTDDEARTCGVERHADLVPGALDDDLGMAACMSFSLR